MKLPSSEADTSVYSRVLDLRSLLSGGPYARSTYSYRHDKSLSCNVGLSVRQRYRTVNVTIGASCTRPLMALSVGIHDRESSLVREPAGEIRPAANYLDFAARVAARTAEIRSRRANHWPPPDFTHKHCGRPPTVARLSNLSSSLTPHFTASERASSYDHGEY